MESPYGDDLAYIHDIAFGQHARRRRPSSSMRFGNVGSPVGW